MLRNRVRHELLPLLQVYNPGISQSLLRLSHIAQDDQAFLDKESTKAWQETAQRIGGNYVFEKRRFQALAPAVQRQVLRKAVNELLGTLKDIEIRHIEEIMEALGKPSGKQVTLPEGLVFSLEYGRYLLGFHPEQLTPFPELKGEFDIKIGGETSIPGWRIETAVHQRETYYAEQGKKDDWNQGDFTACFDSEQIGDKIKVRARRRGDRFQPLGMSRTKKIGEFMLDAKIPVSWRSRIPVFYTPGQIVWLAGWRIDDRVKVTEKTREILCLRMERWLDEQSGQSSEDR
jgi:tRNA(Ile)-lysidine synthase